MSMEGGDGHKSRLAGAFFIHVPYIALTLEYTRWLGSHDSRVRMKTLTLLFPATRSDPSAARVTVRIGTSPAGVLRNRVQN